VSVKTLAINGAPAGAHEDETILEAAREHGITIPTLCHLDGLSEVGACRLCMVEVQGASRFTQAAARSATNCCASRSADSASGRLVMTSRTSLIPVPGHNQPLGRRPLMA